MTFLNKTLSQLLTNKGEVSELGYAFNGEIIPYDEVLCECYAFDTQHLKNIRSGNGKPVQKPVVADIFPDIYATVKQPEPLTTQLEASIVKEQDTYNPPEESFGGNSYPIINPIEEHEEKVIEHEELGSTANQETGVGHTEESSSQSNEGEQSNETETKERQPEIEFDMTIEHAQDPKNFFSVQESQDISKKNSSAYSNYFYVYVTANSKFAIVPYLKSNLMKICYAFKKQATETQEDKYPEAAGVTRTPQPEYIPTPEDFIDINVCRKLEHEIRRTSDFGWYVFKAEPINDSFTDDYLKDNGYVFFRKDSSKLQSQGFLFWSAAYFKTDIPEDIVHTILTGADVNNTTAVDSDKSINQQDFLPNQVCLRIWTKWSNGNKTDYAYYMKDTKIFVDVRDLSDRTTTMLTYAYKKSDFPFLDIDELSKIHCNSKTREYTESIVDALFSEQPEQQQTTTPLSGVSKEEIQEEIEDAFPITPEEVQEAIEYLTPSEPVITKTFEIDEKVNVKSEQESYIGKHINIPYNQVVNEPIDNFINQLPESSFDLIVYFSVDNGKQLKKLSQVIKNNCFVVVVTKVIGAGNAIQEIMRSNLNFITASYLHYQGEGDVDTDIAMLCSRNKPKYSDIPKVLSGITILTDDEMRTTVKSIHPMSNLIKALSGEQDTVLSIHSSDGHVEVACKRLMRKYVGLEPIPEDYEQIVDRLSKDYGYDIVGQNKLLL